MPQPSQPMEEEEEEEGETEEEEEEEEEDFQVQGNNPRCWGWGGEGGLDLGQGRFLTLSSPQEAPPPLTPPQPGSPTKEDKMPPYDEQTQAFIDGECAPGGLGGREPCSHLPL